MASAPCVHGSRPAAGRPGRGARSGRRGEVRLAMGGAASIGDHLNLRRRDAAVVSGTLVDEFLARDPRQTRPDRPNTTRQTRLGPTDPTRGGATAPRSSWPVASSARRNRAIATRRSGVRASRGARVRAPAGPCTLRSSARASGEPAPREHSPGASLPRYLAAIEACTPESPPRATGVFARVTITGGACTLRWTGYPECASERDDCGPGGSSSAAHG